MPLVVGAFVTSVLIAIVPGSRGADFGAISTLPLWPRTAGIMGAEPFICAAVLIPRIGIGAVFIPAVSGRVIPGMIFGQLGLIGAPQTAIKIGRLASVCKGGRRGVADDVQASRRP